MTLRRLIAATSLLVLLAAACGDDDGSEGSASDGESTSELSRYDSVAAMADDLEQAGMSCTLEYEGLDDGTREVSLCTLEGELAELSVWADPGDVASTGEQADLDADPLAAGSNWTVDVQSAATAEQVAEALGGAVRGG